MRSHPKLIGCMGEAIGRRPGGGDGPAPSVRAHHQQRCAIICLGECKRNRLFMAASQSVYSVFVETQGAIGG